MTTTKTPFIGDTEYFRGIGTIPYEGPGSDNPLAFKAYDADRVIGGKTMAEHLRFAVCLWHTGGIPNEAGVLAGMIIRGGRSRGGPG